MISKYIKRSTALLFILIGANKGLAAQQCVQNFLLVDKYDVRYLDISQAPLKNGRAFGQAFMVGKSSVEMSTKVAEIMGSITYRLQNETLRVLSVVDRQSLQGGKIFESLLSKILETNPQITKIVLNIGPRHLSPEEMQEWAKNPASYKQNSSAVAAVMKNLSLELISASLLPVGDQLSLVITMARKP